MKEKILIITSIITASILGFFTAYIIIDVPYEITNSQALSHEFKYMLKEMAYYIGVIPYLAYLTILFFFNNLIYSKALKKIKNKIPITLLITLLTTFSTSYLWANFVEWDQYRKPSILEKTIQTILVLVAIFLGMQILGLIIILLGQTIYLIYKTLTTFKINPNLWKKQYRKGFKIWKHTFGKWIFL